MVSANPLSILTKTFLQVFPSAVELGLIFAIIAIGVYLSFRVLDFPDLTADGSYPMGAAIATIMIVSGENPWFATLIAFAGGAASGIVTAYMSVRFQIMSLLASILTMTALYSINLRIMGRPNISILSEETIFTAVEPYFSSHNHANIALTALIVLVVVGVLVWFLRTDYGLGLRATGSNATMAEAQGVRTKGTIIFGVALSNGLIALAGALYAQSQGFAAVSMGVGVIIAGIASVIVGEAVLPKRFIITALLGCVVGSILYRLCVGVALNVNFFGIQASDNNLVTSIIVAATLILPKLSAQAKNRKARRGVQL